MLTCANGCGKTEGGKEIAALGHDMKETAAAVAATCETAGKTAVLTCANGCGKIEGGEEIAALGHSYSTVVTDPTCEEEGYTTYTCACGATYVDNKVAALGHKNELRNVAEATCTKGGYTGDLVCTVCGKTTAYGQELPALGHSYGDAWVNDADYHWHECSCGDVSNKTEHSWTETERYYKNAHILSDYICEICEYTKTVDHGLLGDADSNGKVNNVDAMLVLQYATKSIDESALNLFVCDVDGDGKVNNVDAMLILQFATKIITSFPIEK